MATKQQEFTGDITSSFQIIGPTYRISQSFVALGSYQMTSLKIWMWADVAHGGSASGTVRIDIHAADASGLPTGDALAYAERLHEGIATTAQLEEFELSEAVDVAEDDELCMVVSHDEAAWNARTRVSHGGVEDTADFNGIFAASFDSGSTYTDYDMSARYEIWGGEAPPSGSGLMQYSGSAKPARKFSGIPSGMVSFTGDAASVLHRTGVASGLTAFTGDGSLSGLLQLIASGQLQFTGDAFLSASLMSAASGSMKFDGSAAPVLHMTTPAGGLVTFSGNALWAVGLTGAGTGHMQFSGSGKAAAVLRSSAVGSVVFDGDAHAALTHGGVATGYMKFDGSGRWVRFATAHGISEFAGTARGMLHQTAGASGTVQFTGDAKAVAVILPTAHGYLKFTGQASATSTEWAAIALENTDVEFGEVKTATLKIGDTVLTEQQLIQLLNLL